MKIKNPLKKQKILLDKNNIDYFIKDIEKEIYRINKPESLKIKHNYLKSNSTIYYKTNNLETKSPEIISIAKIKYNRDRTAGVFRTKKSLEFENINIKEFKLNHIHSINTAFNKLVEKYHKIW